MPEGPLGVPRPFAVSRAEVNIYFEETDLDGDDFIEVNVIAHQLSQFEGPVGGPTGNLNNVATFSSSSNQLTLSGLKKLEERVNRDSHLTVDSVEVIF